LNSSPDIDRKLGTFSSVGDIVSAMKAYAGMTMRRTEEIVPHLREYEDMALAAMGDAARVVADEGLVRGGRRGAGLLVAFGSSQGFCGPYNDRMAARVEERRAPDDTLFVIGARLRESLRALGVTASEFADSPVSVGGIAKTLEEAIGRIAYIYGGGEIYTLTLAFTVVRDRRAEVVFERVLPPDIGRARETASATPPMTYLDGRALFEAVLEEFLYVSLYRCAIESLRSESWYRLNILEGATDSLERHLQELRTMKNFVRQEEITEEMIEILSSGGFYRR
jgi:ATP synthase F1 gamma subunit